MITNNEKEIKEYHADFCGSRKYELDQEEVEALIEGKYILFNDGEYSWELSISKS